MYKDNCDSLTLSNDFLYILLTTREVVRQCRLLSRIDGETVVILDLHPCTNVYADVARQGRDPCGGIC